MKSKNTGRQSRGAVTVFLTLILIPCMIFTCVFGDVSRVALSKSQAAAASDLALYSLMSHYDEELKEWYGLVASCQNIDEFYKLSAEYFVGMMNAKGLDDTASDTLLAYLDAARNGNFSNFLQVDGLDSIKIEAYPTVEEDSKEPSKGSLGGNPALIEDGIVEFMKYRGPVVIAANLIERFGKMDFSGLTDANKNEPIVEAKKAYAEAEGEMMSDLLYTYLAIEQYMDYRTANGMPDLYKYQHEYGEKLSLILEDFKEMTDIITKYYAATDGIKNLSAGDGYSSFPLYDLPDTNNLNNEADAILYVRRFYTYTMSGIGAKEQENGTYTLDDEALTELLRNKDLHVKNVKEAAGRIETACSGITAPTTGGDVNEAVYCMLIQNAIKSNDLNAIHNDGNALMQLYAKLILAQWCDLPAATPAKNWAKEINDTMKEIEEIHKNYLSYTQPSGSFEHLLSKYKAVADVTVENVKQRRYPFYSAFCKRNVTVGDFLTEVRAYLGTLVGHLDAQIANINTILNGGSVEYPSGSGRRYTAVSLSELKQKIINYSNARDTWGSEAKSSDTSYAKAEQDEYNGVEAPGAHVNETADTKEIRKVTARRSAALYENGAQAVEELRTRLTNIRNDMQTLKDALLNCKYGGQTIYNLNRNSAIAAARTVVPTTVDTAQPAYIALSLAQNTSAAQGYHQQLMSGGTYTPPARIPGETGNEPDLKTDIPTLYQYMNEAIHKEDLETAVNNKDEQEKKNKENQDEAKKQSEQSKGFDTGFLNDLGKENPKEVSSSEPFGAGTLLNGLVGVVQKILDGNFDEFRDEIYVCVYIMEMFSYSSYNNEGQYNLSEKPLTLKDYDKSVKAFSNSELQEKWKEEDATEFTDNKSLTNKMINSKNNRSNLAEVEYILYGKATNKDNLEAAYGNIFAIRETLNLVSGFANFYSGTSPTAVAIQSIAAAVMTATMGIIPEAVTKVVLIGVLATMETAHDMQRLKAGVPVVVYKMKEENWVFKLPKDAGDISSIFSGEGFSEPEDKNGLFYSDYLLLFLMIAASSDMYSDMLLRVGDLIEGNMAQQKGKEEYDLGKAQCYFRMTGDLSVKPLLLKLPLVTNYSGADANRLFEVTDWCSYSLDIVRGYS